MRIFAQRLAIFALFMITTAASAVSGDFSITVLGPGGPFTVGESVVFTVTVMNTSATPKYLATVRLMVNGVAAAAYTHNASVAAGQTVALTFPTHTFIAPGVYSIFFDIPGDGPSGSMPVTVNPASPPAAAHPDPTLDAEVRGIVNAQLATAERFMRLQTGNIRSRLVRLRDVLGHADALGRRRVQP